MGDYGDLMRRDAVKNKVKIVAENQPPNDMATRFACPSFPLRSPSIPTAPGPEVRLMVDNGRELGKRIAVQQRLAEKFNQEVQKDQVLQLEAPRNVMEEYFVNILARLRRKEIEEANNAYLTQQQKNDLASEALRVKASMPGGLVQKADEMAQEDIEEDAMEAQAEEEARAADAAAVASAAGQTSDPGNPATSKGTPTVEQIERLGNAMDDLLENAAEKYQDMRRTTAGRQFSLPKPLRSPIIKEVRALLETAQNRGLTSTRINYYYNTINRLLRGEVKKARNNMGGSLNAVVATLREELKRLSNDPRLDITASSASSASSF